MERIRFKKRSNFSYNIIITLLIIGILFLSYRLISKSELFIKDNELPIPKGEMVNSNNEKIKKHEMDFFSEIWVRIKQLNFTDPTVILSSHMPYLNIAHSQSPSMSEPIDEGQYTQTLSIQKDEEISRQLERPSNDEIIHREESDGEEKALSEEIEIEIKKITDSMPPVSLAGEGPQILIYHTHSREAYRQDPESPYKDIAAFRSTDLINQTVTGVGAELAKELQARNIPVLHERTDHEVYPWKAGLYPRSMDTIKKRTKEHDTLKIFLDIHRNYREDLKDPDKEVVIIDGQRVAKFFILIGTAEGVSGGFNEKHNWRENYKFALKITNKVNERHPGLAGDILVRSGRYNQHISPTAILIEVGNHMTTFSEAKRSAKYIAEALSDIIEK